jgi:DNA-binding MarR family transcriptional regulator/N-acetylglutamate synthase-like GNAT family acetyltransferase
MAEADLEQRITAVRRFNRFYTRQIGLLREGYLESPFSLTQVRVLYELAHREDPTASKLARDLELDAGYLSRILGGFERRGLVDKRRSEADGRQALLRLTERGWEAFAPLDRRSHDDIGALLNRMPEAEQERAVEAMVTIERLLGAEPEPRVPYVLRPPQPGDLGWVVQRHGALYAREYGWDETFEALVAEIVARFVRTYDPKRERCWIAEKDAQNVGSVLCVQKSPTVAQLRLLLVEPEARGLGIGKRLVDECIRFARAVGYRKVMLWTNDVLVAARRMYERAGFRLVEEEQHHSFGHDLVGQNWELKL